MHRDNLNNHQLTKVSDRLIQQFEKVNQPLLYKVSSSQIRKREEQNFRLELLKMRKQRDYLYKELNKKNISNLEVIRFQSAKNNQKIKQPIEMIYENERIKNHNLRTLLTENLQLSIFNKSRSQQVSPIRVSRIITPITIIVPEKVKKKQSSQIQLLIKKQLSRPISTNCSIKTSLYENKSENKPKNSTLITMIQKKQEHILTLFQQDEEMNQSFLARKYSRNIKSSIFFNDNLKTINFS